MMEWLNGWNVVYIDTEAKLWLIKVAYLHAKATL